MKTVGIIAEYNPFHNGHAYQVAEARKRSCADAVVAVMSGNFTQRGEAAILDKWHRAELAIMGGVDLVIELPTVFAVRSAQTFAEGGVRILAALGVVSHISFGMESTDMNAIRLAATSFHDYRVIIELKNNLKSGMTYAAALSRALVKICGIPEEIILTPNNILAVEYLRAIAIHCPNLEVTPVLRLGAMYHDTTIHNNLASASAIRKQIYEAGQIDEKTKQNVPEKIATTLADFCLEGWGPVNRHVFDILILARLRSLSVDRLALLPDASEGLHRKIRLSAQRNNSIQGLLEQVKSKRYPMTRLQRYLAYTLLDVTGTMFATASKSGPLYIRVLAFNSRGRKILKSAAEKASLPIITKTTHFLNARTHANANYTPLQEMLALDVKASDIYSLAIPDPLKRIGGQDFTRSPIYIP